MNRHVWLLLLAASAFSCGKESKPKSSEASSPVRVEVEVMRAEPVAALHEASGTLRARNTAVLSARVMGNVSEMRVKAGDAVEAGQVLAVLDAKEVTADLRRAEAGLEEARAAGVEAESGLAAAEAQFRVASATHERFQGLVSRRAATQQEFDEVEARYKGAQAQHAMAQARLARSKAGLAQAQAGVSAARAMAAYTRITAPFAGRVVSRHLDAGNLASPGVPLLKVEEAGPTRVEAWVDESLAGRLRTEEPVLVQLDTLDREVTGRVSEVAPQVDAGSRAFLVKVELPPEIAGPALRPGMFARVSFSVGEQERMLVPLAAVNRSGQLDRVMVAEDEHARMRLVTLGRRYGERVEVLSGLEDGERVVSRWSEALRDGAAVEVVE